MNRLAGHEGDDLVVDVHGLMAQAFQVHLDTACFRVPSCPVNEAGQVEVGSQVPVEPGKDVQIELRSNPFSVVIGGEEEFDTLLAAWGEIDAQQQRVPGPPQLPPQVAQDGGCFCG